MTEKIATLTDAVESCILEELADQGYPTLAEAPMSARMKAVGTVLEIFGMGEEDSNPNRDSVTDALIERGVVDC